VSRDVNGDIFYFLDDLGFLGLSKGLIGCLDPGELGKTGVLDFIWQR
jgi:hypothetical protein